MTVVIELKFQRDRGKAYTCNEPFPEGFHGWGDLLKFCSTSSGVAIGLESESALIYTP